MNIDKEQFDVLEKYMEVYDKEFLGPKFRIYTSVDGEKSIRDDNSLIRFMNLHYEASSRIKKVCINNIKSLKNIEIDLSNLNIVAGVNSIGKSTLLESMALLPRYFDTEQGIIPLGDDKFGIKHFRNFMSNDVELDEHSSISIVYDNIKEEKTIGEVKLSFVFDDSKRDQISRLTKAGRALEIKDMNYLPIKSVSLEILQDPEKTSDLDVIPINAKIKIEKNFKNYEKKSYDLGSHLEKNRIKASAEVKNSLHKEFQKKYEGNDDYVFTVSVNRLDKFDSKSSPTVSLHNLNFNKFKYSLEQKVIDKQISIKKYNYETDVQFLLGGNIAVETTKYLRLLILDIIASENNNLKDNAAIKKEFKKIFSSLLNKTTKEELQKDKILNFIKYAEENTHKNGPLEATKDYQQLRTNSTFTNLLGLRAQAYHIFHQGFRSREKYGTPVNFNEQLDNGTHFIGIFDSCTITDIDPNVIPNYKKSKNDYSEIINLWFEDKFDHVKIKKFIDHVKQEIIDKQETNEISEEVTKFYEKNFGEYGNFLLECSNLIDTYSEKIKNDNFENSKKHLEDFIDKVTLQLKKDNVNFPFTSNLHDNIGSDLRQYTLRDLLLMRIGHEKYSEDDILVPLYKVKDTKLQDFIRAFLIGGAENNEVSDIPIFKSIENFKNIQFLGPLRDRGDSTKLFYTKDIPFTLGIYGEYSKIFLKENALKKSEFITPKLFDEKLISKISKYEELEKSDLKNKINILKKENVISEMTFLDFVSQWGNYIGICEKFEINSDSESPSIFVVDSSGNKIDIVNVGIGVSQVLPVILICSIAELQRHRFSEKDPNIILLEQPELHLHPKAQAKLADFILANSLIDSIVLETHSEYTLNRLRYRHAQLSSLLNNHININYVKKDKNSNPVFEKILINEEGGLNAYPEDFFDQSQLQAQDFIKLKISKTGKK